MLPLVTGDEKSSGFIPFATDAAQLMRDVEGIQLQPTVGGETEIIENDYIFYSDNVRSPTWLVVPLRKTQFSGPVG